MVKRAAVCPTWLPAPSMKRHRHHRKLNVGCTLTARHVTDHLDMMLGRRMYKGFRRHLDRCPNCSAYLDTLLKTVGLYRRYPAPRLTDRAREHLSTILQALSRTSS